MKKLAVLTNLILLGLAGNAQARDPRTYEQSGIYQVYQWSTTDNQLVVGARLATHSVVGQLLTMKVEVKGADAIVQLTHSTGTYRDGSGKNTTHFVFHRSSEIVVSSLSAWTPNLRGYVEDPWLKILRFGGVGGGTTVTVTMEYLFPEAKSSTGTIITTR